MGHIPCSYHSGYAYVTSAFGHSGGFRPGGKYLNPKVKLILIIPKAKLETKPTLATFCYIVYVGLLSLKVDPRC